MSKFKIFKKIIFISMIYASAIALASAKLNDSKKVTVPAGKIPPLVAKPQFRGKTILCDDAKVQKVKVTFGRLTILNFPAPPKDILPGENVFDFKQIRNELAIKALRNQARTNIGIYLQDRRCSFDLVTVPSGGDEVLFVRDPVESQIEVKFHE